LVKETELSRLKVTITNLEVTRQSLKNGVDIQINYLKALAGMPADTALNILPESFIANFNSRPKVDFNIGNVPAYQVLMKQEELANQQISLDKAKYYPTLAAFGQFKFSSFGTTTKIDKINNQNTIGLNLKIPIFASGKNYYKVKQSILKHDQLVEDIEQSKQLLTIQYNNAYSELMTASSLLLVQKENRDLAEKVYRQTLLQYQEGMASLADLLNVNSDFLQADNTFNLQILKCKTSEVKMFKACGSLKMLSENN
jgi:outer membrane protein TolC